MALTASSRGRSEQVLAKKYKERETSPERNRVWSEPSSKLKSHGNGEKRSAAVPVVYYLSRNGQLEHPHFMEVPLPSSQGLFLRDVIERLNFLRGKGMANHYSWSAKRSYKNGYVWHDLEENDFIHPVHGQEYVLKGSEILETSSGLISKSSETASSSSSGKQLPKSDEPDFPARNRRRNQSWSAIDLHEYKVYKADRSGEFSGNAAADAATQTDEKRRRRRHMITENDIVEEEPVKLSSVEQTTELSREEISPPPSDSSPETLESLMKADGRLVLTSASIQAVDSNSDRTAGVAAGKLKPSSVFMSLISCGSISFRDCGAAAVKDHGFSLVSQYKNRLPRGGNPTVDEVESCSSAAGSSFAKMTLEDKEYFSGSLVETRKDVVPALKRSSSYNADRSSQMKLVETGMDGVRAKCIPRKPRAPPSSRESSIKGGDNNNGNDEV